MASAGKKVDSKLASYKNGQLMCVLCNVPVKNEMFWTGHVKGKQHLQTLMQIKRKAESAPSDGTTSAPPAKRTKPAEPEKAVAATPPKSILKTTQQSNDAIFVVPKVPKSTTPSSTLQRPAPVVQQSTPESRSALAKLAAAADEDEHMDILDEAHPPPQQSEVPSSSQGSSLPEGFFDDPKKDAKARGIDFVDPDEAEWSKFMKEIASEEVQSETIQVVDEEESRKERELEEIEEMMSHWQKVIDLEKKKDSRVKKEVLQNVDMESSSDEDIEDDLDWRIKKVSKNKNS